MVQDRRPRIKPELADKIDQLREEAGGSFEHYVNTVLERHAARELGPHDDDYFRERDGDRRHTATDPGGAILYVDKPSGEHHDYENVLGMLVVDDEGYEPVGFYMTEQETRALRDLCTELLGELDA
jgi:hypothetical protein